MPFELQEIYLVYGFAAVTAIFAVEAFYIVFVGQHSRRNQVNRRLKLKAASANNQDVMLRLRRERGLTSDGGFLLSWHGLNRLFLQSGVTLSVGRLLAMVAGAGAAVFVVLLWLSGSLMQASMSAIAASLFLPLVALQYLRKKRQAKFANQFPDAIDIITRSLRAGHPVPVAIAMVAREMPDPIGSEFGLISDEVTYGSELEPALRSLNVRVGQDDLPLFITAVAIQSTTGGNLSEILDKIADVIRQRIKLRRKVRAISAEGRFSALALSALPIAFLGVVQMVTPEFYGGLWDHKVVQFGLAAAGVWMMIGNAVMYKLVNFRI